jgi:hypothetical protein
MKLMSHHLIDLKKIQKTLVFCIILVAISPYCNSQVYSNKVLGEEEKKRVDSLSNVDYPYMLPIWGAKVTALGFDIPYSAGLSINYLSQESQLVINNLNVGINNGDLLNLDNIIRFKEVIGTTQGLNVRPDLWIFPFLNVYGILASSKTSTVVDFGVWLPNGQGDEEVINYRTTAEFDATSLGFGITPTIGVGGGWLALDMNFTWTDISELDKPAYSFIFGPRLGKSIQLGKPERSVAVWVGGFRVKLSSETNGNILLSEVLPENGEFNTKISNGLDEIAVKQNELDTWWEGLSLGQQKLNQLKYNAAGGILNVANQTLTRLDEAAENLESSTISYSLDKKLKDKWNFLVGSQFQLNKHWMIRAELGFLKSRKQIITGLQYRFGL